jgi:UDP-glucose 4-epimerase
MTTHFDQNFQGVKAVILGATGFIGRWVAHELSKSGAKLALPVRDSVGAKTLFDQYDIAGQVIELDILDRSRLRELFFDLRPSVTFNLAGYGIDRNENDPEMAFRVNSKLVEDLCHLVSSYGNPDWPGMALVHAGTAMEYGAIGGDLSEDSVPRPTTLYGKSKLSGTNHVSQACKDRGLRGVTARLFSVYGPGEAPKRLLPTLIDSAEGSHPIRLTSGDQLRDFVYVEDVASGLLRLAATDVCPSTVNIASGKLTTVRSFVEIAAEHIGIEVRRLHFGAIPMRIDEMYHDPVKNSRLVNCTGWNPTISVSTGVEKTLEFDESRSVKARRSDANCLSRSWA